MDTRRKIPCVGARSLWQRNKVRHCPEQRAANLEKKKARRADFTPFRASFLRRWFSVIWKGEKYKPYILKYKALILKQVPCIFCLSITLFFRYLQNGDFRPFRDSFFAPDFDIIQEQTSILSVPERPSTVYSVFPALRPFRNGNKNPRKCTFYICEPMLCTTNAANFTRKRIFPEIMCISCVNWRFYIIL